MCMYAFTCIYTRMYADIHTHAYIQHAVVPGAGEHVDGEVAAQPQYVDAHDPISLKEALMSGAPINKHVSPCQRMRTLWMRVPCTCARA